MKVKISTEITDPAVFGLDSEGGTMSQGGRVIVKLESEYYAASVTWVSNEGGQKVICSGFSVKAVKKSGQIYLPHSVIFYDSLKRTYAFAMSSLLLNETFEDVEVNIYE